MILSLIFIMLFCHNTYGEGIGFQVCPEKQENAAIDQACTASYKTGHIKCVGQSAAVGEAQSAAANAKMDQGGGISQEAGNEGVAIEAGEATSAFAASSCLTAFTECEAACAKSIAMNTEGAAEEPKCEPIFEQNKASAKAVIGLCKADFMTKGAQALALLQSLGKAGTGAGMTEMMAMNMATQAVSGAFAGGKSGGGRAPEQVAPAPANPVYAQAPVQPPAKTANEEAVPAPTQVATNPVPPATTTATSTMAIASAASQNFCSQTGNQSCATCNYMQQSAATPICKNNPSLCVSKNTQAQINAQQASCKNDPVYANKSVLTASAVYNGSKSEVTGFFGQNLFNKNAKTTKLWCDSVQCRNLGYVAANSN